MAIGPELGQGDPLYAMTAELSEEGEALVEEAVAWLHATARESGLELAVRVREYVLERFFGGSFEAFTDLSPTKSMSFSALCERKDLPFARATLFTLVRVGQQLEELPPSLARGLTVRHHRALLPLADPEAKRRLAEEAIAERWTSDELTAAVQAERPPRRPGPKPQPQALKDFRAFQRTVREHKLAPKRLVATLNAGERQELASVLTTLEARISALRRALDELAEA